MMNGHRSSCICNPSDGWYRRTERVAVDFRESDYSFRKWVELLTPVKILEGITTILIGIAAALILPADLASASFLTQEERDFAGTPPFSW